MARISTLPSVPEPLKPAAAIEDARPGAQGLRKLVRPMLPSVSAEGRGMGTFGKRDEMPILAHQMALDASSAAKESTHAEAFYLQKQVQTQTLMVFVLEDGERIEGFIEWYDRTAIKVRHGGRTLIYKAGIKYLYKASDNGG